MLKDITYCTNPFCENRKNPSDEEVCLSCGRSLRIAGRYKVLRPLVDLTKPRPTEVFEVTDERGKLKILKLLRAWEPAYERLFEREITYLRMLRHPSIPRLYGDDIFEFKLDNGTTQYGFVMQRFEGESLKTFLEQGNRISVDTALDWLHQLGEILHFLHKERLIHRDIKPSNIILQPSGQLALIDFGGIRPASTETYIAKVGTGDLTKLCSDGYTPPEQSNGKVLPQSDFYALGRTIICLLTGKDPQDLNIDPYSGQAQWRHLVPNLNKKLEHLLDRMTSFAPGERPCNTDELLQLITNVNARKSWHQFLNKTWILPIGVFVVMLSIGSHLGLRRIFSNMEYYNAMQHKAQGNLIAARSDLESSVSLRSTSKGYTELGRVCSELQDIGCALEAYRESIRLKPNWQAFFEMGFLYDKAGMNNQAALAYQKAISNGQGKAVAAYSNLARIRLLQNEPNIAVELIREGLKTAEDPSRLSNLYKNLGWAYLLQGKTTQAENALAKSISLKSTNTASHCLKAKVLEAQGKGTQDNWVPCLTLNFTQPEVQKWREDYLRSLQKAD